MRRPRAPIGFPGGVEESVDRLVERPVATDHHDRAVPAGERCAHGLGGLSLACGAMQVEAHACGASAPC